MSEIRKKVKSRQDFRLNKEIKSLALKISNRCHALKLIKELQEQRSVDPRILMEDSLREEYHDLTVDLGKKIKQYEEGIKHNSHLRDASVEKIKDEYKKTHSGAIRDNKAKDIQVF